MKGLKFKFNSTPTKQNMELNYKFKDEYKLVQPINDMKIKNI